MVSLIAGMRHIFIFRSVGQISPCRRILFSLINFRRVAKTSSQWSLFAVSQKSLFISQFSTCSGNLFLPINCCRIEGISSQWSSFADFRRISFVPQESLTLVNFCRATGSSFDWSFPIAEQQESCGRSVFTMSQKSLPRSLYAMLQNKKK